MLSTINCVVTHEEIKKNIDNAPFTKVMDLKQSMGLDVPEEQLPTEIANVLMSELEEQAEKDADMSDVPSNAISVVVQNNDTGVHIATLYPEDSNLSQDFQANLANFKEKLIQAIESGVACYPELRSIIHAPQEQQENLLNQFFLEVAKQIDFSVSGYFYIQEFTGHTLHYYDTFKNLSLSDFYDCADVADSKIAVSKTVAYLLTAYDDLQIEKSYRLIENYMQSETQAKINKIMRDYYLK